MKTTVICLFISMFLSILVPAPAAWGKCKYEVDEPDVQETKVFIIGRGFNTGLSGHMGRSGDMFYLRGRYVSSFAGVPVFDHSTPMTLTFADGSSITLPILEGAEGKLDYHPMLANNREAMPVFLVTGEHLQKIKAGNIKTLDVRRIDKGKLGTKHYKLAKRFSRNFAAAAVCVSGSQAIGAG